MDKKEIILIAATVTGLYLVLRGLRKNGSGTKDENFKNATGENTNQKPILSQRSEATRCETNLERLGRLFPDTDQYNAEVGKAYQQQGNNFSSWAQSTAKPCFVVGAEQGGLQSGLKGINLGPKLSSNLGKIAKSKKSTYNNYIGSEGQGTYFNAHGDMSLENLVRSYKRP